MKFRKKPVVIDATQWFKNGDHPADHHVMDEDLVRTWPSMDEYRDNVEGAVVRRFRHPETPGEHKCMYCNVIMHEHGWIDTLEGGHVVCPGDWIITGVRGERYPCKPEIFAATYEPAESA